MDDLTDSELDVFIKERLIFALQRGVPMGLGYKGRLYMISPTRIVYKLRMELKQKESDDEA